MNWDEIYDSLIYVNLIIILFIGACFNLLMEPSFSFGFFSGAIIMLVNFHIMQKNIRALFIKEKLFQKAKTIIPKFYFRLEIIGIIIYILLDKKVDSLGLVMGISAVMCGIVGTGIYYGVKYNRKDKA